jgi:hypothetical protein
MTVFENGRSWPGNVPEAMVFFLVCKCPEVVGLEVFYKSMLVSI